MANSVLQLCLQNDPDDLDYGRDTIGLTDTDIEQITTLPKQEGVYSTVYVVSRRGRGAVRVALADLEYWICSAQTPSTTSPAAPKPSETPTATRGRRCGCCAPPTGTSTYRDRHRAT